MCLIVDMYLCVIYNLLFQCSCSGLIVHDFHNKYMEHLLKISIYIYTYLASKYFNAL